MILTVLVHLELGRDTEEYTNARVDILIDTLGSICGVKWWLHCFRKRNHCTSRETALLIFILIHYSGEACATLTSIDILDSPQGLKILAHLKQVTNQFREGLKLAGWETLPGDHPVVPLMVRDTAKTKALVHFLTENNILATGMNFPVVPKGDEEIRFQISADHTVADIDYVLEVLKSYKS